MPLYFIHIRTPNGMAIDPEGEHLDGFEALQENLKIISRELLSEYIRRGEVGAADAELLVEDEHGDIIHSFRLRDAMQ
jgi:hypothetical protein